MLQGVGTSEITLVMLAGGTSARFTQKLPETDILPKQLFAFGPNGETIPKANWTHFRRALRAAKAKGRLVLVTRKELHSHFTELLDSPDNDPQLPVSFAFIKPVPRWRKNLFGTGSGVVAAHSVVAGPFIIANSDDIYSEQDIKLMVDHLIKYNGTNVGGVVGYRLSKLLSPYGSVNAGVIDVDNDGFLRRIVEIKDIRRSADGIVRGASGDGTGRRVELFDTSRCSANLWAIPNSHEFFAEVGKQYQEWLQHIYDSQDSLSEFYLPAAIQGAVSVGTIRIKVVPTESVLIGATLLADVSRLRAYFEKEFVP